MRQIVIGLTGGTGCGKTTALNVLEELGAAVIDCDALYHEMLRSDRELVAAIAAAFPGVVEDGVLQRKKLGAVVFSDPAQLQRLNGITTPRIVAAVKKQVEAEAPRPCAIDAVGLTESGLGALCTHTVAVTAPREARIRRLMVREGISEDYAKLRIDAQKENEVFAADCGMTIENHYETAEDFAACCRNVFSEMLKEEPS